MCNKFYFYGLESFSLSWISFYLLLIWYFVFHKRFFLRRFLFRCLKQTEKLSFWNVFFFIFYSHPLLHFNYLSRMLNTLFDFNWIFEALSVSLHSFLRFVSFRFILCPPELSLSFSATISNCLNHATPIPHVSTSTCCSRYFRAYSSFCDWHKSAIITISAEFSTVHIGIPNFPNRSRM